MEKQNLLELVPDHLFQNYFIHDIDKVQKKLQNEIERKKEELRAMVGEKYRDLIQAADTIEQMRGTTASALKHINEMTIGCKNLNKTHLLGFKNELRSKPSSSILKTNQAHIIAVQVKLLMDIPEKIWKCIDQENFIKAAQLYIMARHVNTGIQLQIGSKNSDPQMQSLQRLVHMHWTTISNFHDTIIKFCKEKLQDLNISAEITCSCLVSLYLLDSQTMTELLNTFIAVHSRNSLKSTLQFDLAKILDGDVKAKIKENLVNGVKIVIKTAVLVYSCFVENNGGMVLEKLKHLYSKDSQPLIELVQFSDTKSLKILPTVITGYHLSTNKDPSPLAKEDLSDCIHKWSDWVKSFIDVNVKTLLQNVPRAKILQEIREEAFKVETPQNWSQICHCLAIPEIHVWNNHFQPLLTARVKQIIDNRWTKLYDTFKTQMLIDLTRVSSDLEVEKEADINWFVWKDLIGDTVIESRGDVVQVMNGLMKGMWLQDRGFTPTLEKLCKSLDTELQRLIEDLGPYLKRDAKKLYLFEDDEQGNQLYSDAGEVREYLKDACDNNVGSMLLYIKACFEESTLQSNELQKKTVAIFTARFTQAIVNLMPALHRCYNPNTDSHSLSVSDPESAKRWSDVCANLKESCLYCWGKWVDIALARVVELTMDLPQEFTLEANIEYLMMQWDLIKIEEKDDEGNSIESTIKVPAGPSLKLQEYLYASSRILDEVIPHTLPNEIHKMYTEKLAFITLTHYNKVIREKEAEINQRCALQLLMDVRHLTLLLVPRENKKTMELSQDICEFIRQKIDPFDYDVFYPYIQNNLKSSVQKVQTLFGSVILEHGQLSGIVGTKPLSQGGNVTTPALLAHSGDSRHWFSLLPIAASATNEQQKKKQQTIAPSPSKVPKSDISELMTSSLPINFANARSGAASFFNSMTSDWFSGS